MSEPGERMLDSLPAIYRVQDAASALQRLLGVFEEVLFGNGKHDSAGIEEQIEAIPSIFSPLGNEYTGEFAPTRTPDRFLPWLATWVAFTPHALFTPERLREIISGIAPLYGKRGTRTYMKELLELCFPEILGVEIDDDPVQGFIIGKAKVGSDTLFGNERPFWFRVDIHTQGQHFGKDGAESADEFERRVRAIIDFAKPAHTAYELRLSFSAENGGGYWV